MRRLKIKNVGPVVSADIELTRYNVFIGKQSSGKSTIAKIISNVTWLEKEISIHPSTPLSVFEAMYKNELIKFHNLEGYFHKDSFLNYESDFLSITLENDICSIIRNNSGSTYHRKKTLYIPSERNMVVYTDSIGGASNLRSFATDWQDARDIFNEKHMQSILNLGVRYYKTGENGKSINHIISSSNRRKYDINLKCGSSGLQSLIPITTTIDFYTGGFYDVGNQEKLMKSNDMYDIKQLFQYFIKNRKITELEDSHKIVSQMMDDVLDLVLISSTSFVIEEPENNLFPETQFELIKFIIECTKRENRYHEATITTHSPYVLSTLNLLLLSGKIMKEGIMDGSIKKMVNNCGINNGELSAWMVSDGKVSSIMDKSTEMISENYLDGVSDVLAGKFNELYRHYLNIIRKN